MATNTGPHQGHIFQSRGALNYSEGLKGRS